MSTSRFDALIVGAGPAGSWAAYRLARAGARVAILDGSHPREKPCGGGITGRALEIVRPALDPSVLTAVPVKGATFTHQARAAQVELNGDASGYPPLIVAGRRDFDAALLNAAIGAGAAHKPFRVTNVRRESQAWLVETREGTERADWIIGADGANSLVRRHVARPFSRGNLSIAAGYFVHGQSAREIVVEFENEPSGYLWSFPRRDHLAVGVCAQADLTSSSALLCRARQWVAQHVAGERRLEKYSWPIPSLCEAALSSEHPAGLRWMLVGDAAGLVDPITREGIYFAIRSGDFAADALINCADSGGAYVERVRSEIHGELVRAARLKARFFQPRFVGLLVAALGRSGRVQGVMADLIAGRQTYRGLRRRLLRTLEWRLMLELFGH
jgi:geranylgeranyl reductase family protein